MNEFSERGNDGQTGTWPVRGTGEDGPFTFSENRPGDVNRSEPGYPEGDAHLIGSRYRGSEAIFRILRSVCASALRAVNRAAGSGVFGLV
jgi:hypothetical protein